MTHIYTHTHTHTHTHNGYYSAIKKNVILPVAAMWMDIENIMFSEISQTEQLFRFHIRYHLYVKSKNIIQMNIYVKQKQTHRYRKQTCGYQRGEGWGRDKSGV